MSEVTVISKPECVPLAYLGSSFRAWLKERKGNTDGLGGVTVKSNGNLCTRVCRPYLGSSFRAWLKRATASSCFPCPNAALPSSFNRSHCKGQDGSTCNSETAQQHSATPGVGAHPLVRARTQPFVRTRAHPLREQGDTAGGGGRVHPGGGRASGCASTPGAGGAPGASLSSCTIVAPSICCHGGAEGQRDKG